MPTKSLPQASGHSPRKVRGFAILVTTFFLALGLAACGRNSGPGNAAGSPSMSIDPCALVTRADAERVLGTRVKPAIRRETVLMATGRECHYIATATPVATADGTGGITLTVYDDASIHAHDSLFKNAGDYFRRNINALRSSGTTLVPVRGLGEAAYWQPGADLLHVLVRGVYVMLDVNAVAHIPPGPGERIRQRADVAKRAAGIALVRDTILPRLADSRSLSSSKPPPNGHGGHSS
jgi:hypothetical protein